MTVPADVAEFWSDFCVAAGEDCDSRFFEAFHFDDNEASANVLAQLVLAGIKRATSSLVWSIEAGGASPLPSALSIVTDWTGTPLCVIETVGVEVVPFAQVSAEFAATEGEGDGSLAYWREAHWNYFGRECVRLGRQPSHDMPVLCERFRVVYRPVGASSAS